MPISKIRLYQRDGSCATFETKSFYCRALRGSCPLEFFIVFRPKNTEKIMRQSYAYVANESTPARIKLNHNIHIPSDIHTLYWYAWGISVLSHFFTAVWVSIKWNYFFAFLLSALRAQYQHPSMTAKKAVEKIFAALIKINWSWYTQYPLSWPFLSHFRVGHGTRKNFANIPSSPKFILLNRSKPQGKSVEHCMLH